MAMQITPDGKVDRQTITPFHLKLFYRTGGFHRLEDFPSSAGGHLPPHLQIYTWPSCTLRELSHLLGSALPNLLREPLSGTRLSYRLIFPDTRDGGRTVPGRYQFKDLGDVIVGGDKNGSGILPREEEVVVITSGPMAGELSGEPDKTLQDARFVIGDYISCAIYPPNSNASNEPPAETRVPGRRGAGGGREMREGYGGGRGGYSSGAPRDGDHDRFNGRGGRGGRGGGSFHGAGREIWGLPSGEWRRGERLPDGSGGRGYGRGRGRGY